MGTHTFFDRIMTYSIMLLWEKGVRPLHPASMAVRQCDTLLSRYATTPQRSLDVILLSLQVVVVGLHGRFLPSQLGISGGGIYGCKS